MNNRHLIILNGVFFEAKMSQTLYRQMEESVKLDAVIRKDLEGSGCGAE